MQGKDGDKLWRRGCYDRKRELMSIKLSEGRWLVLK
jgi:hypothetical protein